MNEKNFEESVKERGLSSLPKEKQEEMVERIGRLLYEAVLSRAMDMLDEKDETELDLLLNEETSTVEEVLGFLETKVASFGSIVSEEKAKLKTDLRLV